MARLLARPFELDRSAVELAIGHAHWGLTLGPATGRLIAELILDGRTSLDIAQLSIERFRTGSLLRSRYKDDPIMA